MHSISKMALMSMASFFIAGVSHAQIHTHTDASGKVTVAVFERTAGNFYSHYTDFAVDVPDQFVVIGGGAVGAGSPAGNFLTASYPNNNLSSWLVSTKDHVDIHKVNLRAYAIGLKIAGLSRDQLLNYIKVNAATSVYAAHPDISVGVPYGYSMIGGGFKVNWVGGGNIATASYPENAYSWRVRSKDHKVHSHATIDAYAVGLLNSIPNVGKIAVNISVATSGYAQHTAGSVNVAAGYALTGCGAAVHYGSGGGNLLWKLMPVKLLNQHNCEAASKDLIYPNPATLSTYAIGIKVE